MSAPPPTAGSALAGIAAGAQAIGPRALQRATPRFGALVAVLGAIVATVGAFQLAGSSQAGVTLVALVLTGGGYALVWTQREGALASAGAATSAAGLPLVLGSVATLVSPGSSGATVAVVLTLAGSLAGWCAAYAVGPGRGHLVYAGAALVGLAVGAAALFGRSGSVIGVVIVLTVLSALYVAAGWALDRQGVGGLATAFVGVGVGVGVVACLVAVAGIVGSTVGDAFDDLTSSSSSSSSSRSSSSRSGSSSRFSTSSSSSSSGGSGSAEYLLPALLFIPGGIALIRYGVGALRRATAWCGVGIAATGAFLLPYSLFAGSPAAVTFVLLVLGGGAVAGGWWIQGRLAEPGELVATPSFVGTGLLAVLKDRPGAVPGAPGPGWWMASDGQWYPPAGTAPTPAPPAAAAPAAGGVPGAPGPGWWMASDGQWYPPAGTAPTPAPPATAAPAAGGVPGAPGPGWWMASDGQWYPPEARETPR